MDKSATLLFPFTPSELSGCQKIRSPLEESIPWPGYSFLEIPLQTDPEVDLLVDSKACEVDSQPTTDAFLLPLISISPPRLEELPQGLSCENYLTTAGFTPLSFF